MMPGLDGPELCRRIRHDATLEQLYVILLTGRKSLADIVTGLDAGADDYIVKPFNQDELRARVRVGMRVAQIQERLADKVAELEIARNDLARLASTDVLTGLLSRRRWFELARGELTRYHRYHRPLAFMMLDLDLFKNVNDTFGHNVGDDVLKAFAEVFRHHCRESDVAGRVGGEEFAVMLPETDTVEAEELATRMAEQCRSIAVTTSGVLVRFSCSIGVTVAMPNDDSVETVLRRADAALYKAKRNGRDRVEVLHSAA